MAKEIQVFGAVVLKRKEAACTATAPHSSMLVHHEYHDDDIKNLVGKKVGAFGRSWIFAGDVPFHECDITITVKWDDGQDHQTFVGRSALKEALVYIQKHSE